MTHRRLARATAFAAAVATIAAAACSSDNSTLSAPQTSARTTSNDTGGTTGGHQSGGSGDTTVAQTPATAFTLVAHVGIGNSSADTLSYTPLAGATVAVSSYYYQYSGHPGPDSETVVTTAIGSGTTDATGAVSFAKLAPNLLYQIDVTPPAGSGVSGTTLRIAPGYPATTNVYAILRP